MAVKIICTNSAAHSYYVLSKTKGGDLMRKKHSSFSEIAIAFGLGLILSCFCPIGLVFFILGVIIVSLGVMLSKKR